MIRKNYPVLSVLHSPDMAAPGVIRAPRGTNPVNSGKSGKRETVPLTPNATPRMKHPKLNTEPWSKTYAQARGEPKTARPVSRYRAAKRQRKARGR